MPPIVAQVEANVGEDVDEMDVVETKGAEEMETGDEEDDVDVVEEIDVVEVVPRAHEE